MNTFIVLPASPSVVQSAKPTAKIFILGAAAGVLGTLIALDQFDKRKDAKAFKRA